ncbi:MAG: ester cyclase [Gemmatimonadota bacterium]|nr:MAG: ester cyclase [Gemmatimonadota bacterium]
MRPSTFVLSSFLAAAAVGCAPLPTAELEANKDLVRRFTDALNAADWDALDELATEDFTRHSEATAGPQANSREEFIQLQESFLVTFPDQRVTIEKLIAEGDNVALLAKYSGTQTGPMGDYPATGRSFESTFLAFFRIEAGRVAELWVEWDNVAMLTQLGLFPPPPPAGT